MDNKPLTQQENTIKKTSLLTFIAVFVGAAVGSLVSLFMSVLAELNTVRDENIFYVLPLLPLGGALIAYAYNNYGRGAEKGLALVFAAGHGSAQHIPLRMIPFIMVSAWITHFFGGSIGRAGVVMQVGASLAHRIGKFVAVYHASHILLLAGMAAGFAALFGTPLAASSLAVELLLVGRFDKFALPPAIAASFSASSVASFFGFAKFSHPLAFTYEVSLLFLVKLVLLGAIFGIVGGAYSTFSKNLKVRLAFTIRNGVKRALVFGTLLALLLALFSGRYSGTGSALIVTAFLGGEIYYYDWLLKFLLTALTIAAGFQGGEVSPLFCMGTTLGFVLGGVFGVPLELSCALGYVAVFCGGTNTLITPVLIGAEVFGVETLPLFALVCLASYKASGNRSIYPIY